MATNPEYYVPLPPRQVQPGERMFVTGAVGRAPVDPGDGGGATVPTTGQIWPRGQRAG